jgi:small subunit ribosomal protein S3Ae
MAKEVKEQKKEGAAAKPQQKARKKSVDKWKKKSWYTIIAPEEFERKELGETISEKPENVVGRVVNITAGELANQPKKSHIHIKFKVVNVTANKAHAEAVGHTIKDTYLKRIIRRRSSKIMIVGTYASKDKKNFSIKTIIVTEKKASNRQKASILKKANEIVAKFISNLESKKVVEELVFGNLPNKIFPEIKKIVPIKRIEIVNSALLKAK